ncbi:ER membrane protein complex subunit 8-like [Oppia nitens]|uniref:ER membrane protein complex subunit 8-like n=1 Tax=Oppia nitens TaxID=1686743 RepID=UPI0023DC7AA6|nr:ER membrane protein complex subunit 8-like [Oppia nitens]
MTLLNGCIKWLYNSSVDYLPIVVSFEDMDVIVWTRCYVKMCMHSLKYPHSTVCGLLVCQKSKKSSNQTVMEILDCIPLIHSGHGLTHVLETALIQISNYYKSSDVQIGGLYQANKYFFDSTPTVFAQRIGEKLLENNSEAMVVMVNNLGLAQALDDHNEIESALTVYHFNDQKWKSRSGGYHFDNPKQAFDAVQEFIFKDQKHLNLIDFDNHLDDIRLDWNNKHINDMIDKWIKVSDI